MPVEIFMPALSPTMEVGNLASWLVKEGDTVSAGDVIAEIETDKATMEVEAVDEGVIGKILIDAGAEDVPVGTTIAWLLEEGEDASALEGAEASGNGLDQPVRSEPVEERTEDVPAAPPSEIQVSAPAGDDRVKASPLARRIAQQKGIDLSAVAGSGPGGRVVKRDLEDAGAIRASTGSARTEAGTARPELVEGRAQAPDYGPPADVPYEEVKLTAMRKVIARRMAESKATVPHFYLTIECAVDKLLAQRKELNAKLESEGVKLSVNDFIIRAMALAMKKVPDVNAQYAGDVMYKFSRQDISVAVAIPGGLVTPVVRDAGAKGLAQISAEMKELAGKAREGKLLPEEYQGGTISLSNLGMYGIHEFGAVINPPQGAILAVGAGEKRPVVEGDAVAIRTMMNCTLAVDHRAMDGAIGSEFLAAFKALIEDPLTMLL